uniref:Potassium channel subfamily K member 13 n=1 Tax=Knipowitschia caucasica TaxID=637954 RepID=A0AAV2K837_KNICA
MRRLGQLLVVVRKRALRGGDIWRRAGLGTDKPLRSYSVSVQHHATGAQVYIMACRSGCCCGSVNEDNARFLLLALFIVLYLLCGAAVFSALEQPKEREAKERWTHSFELFRQKYNLSAKELNNFLRNYEEANVAGIRVDTVRPRWDFTGAFYFVGTVVSTIASPHLHITGTLEFCQCLTIVFL